MAGTTYKPVIGMEIHVQLATKSGMFCGCPAESFGKEPNTQTCPVCLGLPGALPVPNKKAVDWTIMLGLALGGVIAKTSKFDRKHYFYPDLPKGYQISQYDKPLSTGGQVETSLGLVRIRRVHLEEDTGKLMHTEINGKKVSLVDFNRSGVPLVEIVTEPDIRTGAQAKEFARELQKIVRKLGISDCDMEKGSMRLEANISWGLQLGYKVEVKNLNSFRFVDKAINFELTRQKGILDSGQKPQQETRGYSEATGETFSQRSKETEADYRYFPEPDIPPMVFSDSDIAKLKKLIPELPQATKERLIKDYGIRSEYAHILVQEEIVDFAEKAMARGKELELDSNKVISAIINKKIKPDIKNISVLLAEVKRSSASKLSDISTLLPLIKRAINETPQAVADYRSGKKQAIGVLVGKVMTLSKGNADAKVVQTLLEQNL